MMAEHILIQPFLLIFHYGELPFLELPFLEQPVFVQVLFELRFPVIPFLEYAWLELLLPPIELFVLDLLVFEFPFLFLTSNMPYLLLLLLLHQGHKKLVLC